MLRALPDLLFVFNRDSVYLDYYAPDATRPLRVRGSHRRCGDDKILSIVRDVTARKHQSVR